MKKEYFLSINEVSKRLDLPAYTLRYWEKQFPVKIKPTTGAGGRRYYRPETVTALQTIKELLYNRGLTIAGVKTLLKEGNFPDSADNVVGLDNQKNINVIKENIQLEKNTVVKKVSQPKSDGLFSSGDEINQAIDLLERAKKELQ